MIRSRLSGVRVDWAGIARYLIPTAIMSLVFVAGGAIVLMLVSHDDAVVIEVVPIQDSGQIQVQVAGSVHNPGVYDLPPGSTVGDALAAAGGTLSADAVADTGVAEALADGQYIYVDITTPEGTAGSGPVDINSASISELETLPGIGPVLAERIVEYRESVAAFASVEELSVISGISMRMVDELRPLVVVESR